MVRLGILGCSEIAYRRFMPAAEKSDALKVIAVAEEFDKSKLKSFCQAYSLETEDSFEQLISRPDLDAVYVPQPPALHYEWVKKALLKGKHVLVEKPSTVSVSQTGELVRLAESRQLALHENYMFQYHSQIKEIKAMLADGMIGDVRLIRADFGFPMRAKNDFRYEKALGGGALLDAGGYTAKLAAILLGDTVKTDAASLCSSSGYDVDLYGSASFSNEDGAVCQVGFGMDCFYRCSLEVWGSKGRLSTNRIFTAPDDFQPSVKVETSEGEEVIGLKADSHFLHSIEMFLSEITDPVLREKMYREIMLQAKLMEEMKRLGTN